MRFLNIFFLIVLFLSIFVPRSWAAETKNVTIINPIRGSDFWQSSTTILETPLKQYELISKDSLSATWLVRYDALKNQEVVDFLHSLNSQQEVGLFLEITPTLAQEAGVSYNQSPNWHYAKSVLLIGYSPQDRLKLIDRAVGEYQKQFSKTPKSVGAWWIDAYSLSYLRDKYGVEANLAVADQYSTDQYQVWGQYWSIPYYPSKTNALMPAGSPDHKIGLVTLQWATRDPYNAYGNGVGDSTYSVQVNDYALHKLGIDYFEKLLAIYPQVVVGLENDFSWKDFGEEYQKQLALLKAKQKSGELVLTTMSGFAASYQQANPGISPNVLISSDDPLGGSGKVVWYQTPKYRVGWFAGPFGSVIRDLRAYDDASYEGCYKTACVSLDLNKSFLSSLDEVTFGTSWVLDEGVISDFSVNRSGDIVQVNYKNHGGSIRTIRFLPNDIEVNGKTQPISFAILEAANSPRETLKDKSQVGSDWSQQLPLNWPSQILSLGKFIVLTLLFFLLPGLALGRKWLLAIPVGWSAFTLASFVSGFFRLDFLLWALPLGSVIWIKKSGLPQIHWPALSKQLIWTFVLIITGSSLWLLTTVKSGLFYTYGLGFWGPNGHDGIWHLALISELQRNFPPQNPIFSGLSLNNYHYFFDLLLAKSGSLFGIQAPDLLFRLFPLFLAPLLGLLMFKVVQEISKSFKAAFLAVFLLYFGSGFGWLVSFFRDRAFGGESLFWSQQASSTLLNPPFAISLVLFLSGLYLYYQYINQKRLFSKEILLPLILLWGSLIEFKAYAGLLVLASLGLVALEKLILEKDAKLLPLFLGSSILSAIIFLPNNLGGSSLFVFSPLWFVNTMVLSPDRLGWVRLSMAMESNNIFKVISSYSLGIAIFFIGNLGVRVIALGSWRVLFKDRLLFYFVLFGLIIPLLFIQKGTNWNSIQFMYYSMLVLNIFAAIALAKGWEKWGRKFVPIIVILLLINLPAAKEVFSQYLPARPPARLTNAEIQALDFLKAQPSGMVLTLPFDSQLKNRYSEPLPLIAYTSTSYVAAFSNHPTFLEDTVNLDILGVDYKGRLNKLRDFLKIRDEVKNILKENNIKYVYMVNSQGFEEDEGRMGIKKIFENEEVKIFQVL